jgi:hypothetical protein
MGESTTQVSQCDAIVRAAAQMLDMSISHVSLNMQQPKVCS